jgi:hypothetical protein
VPTMVNVLYVLQKNAMVTYKGGSVAMMMAYANVMPLSLYYSGVVW